MREVWERVVGVGEMHRIGAVGLGGEILVVGVGDGGVRAWER